MKFSIKELKEKINKPEKVIVTAGMPYANGPLHLGHLAGAHIPADIYARFYRMLIGKDNVLFVSGTDDHGSTSELAAKKAGKDTESFINEIRAKQKETLSNYNISLDVYSGTSAPELKEIHQKEVNLFLTKLNENNMLVKKSTMQWFDPSLNLFLQDRYVRGKCPNSNCDNKEAYSEECEKCGLHYVPSELIDPKSSLSESSPILKETMHWFLDMWKVSEPLLSWVKTKEKKWRKPLYQEVYSTIEPAVQFSKIYEDNYKTIKNSLPSHKSRYGSGKTIVVSSASFTELANIKNILAKEGIESKLLNSWSFRAISRDVSWGMKLPFEGSDGKTLYVWPDSLIAPISFTKLSFKEKDEALTRSDEFWKNDKAKIAQFLGQDNVFFYSLMQGAMWLGVKDDITSLPKKGEYQLSDLYSVNHLMVNGEKMSKSKGNFYSGDDLLSKNYDADQIRYFLSTLNLSEKSSNFDFDVFLKKCELLSGAISSAFERPISAVHSKFDGIVPTGQLMEKVTIETTKIIEKYLKAMEKAEYSNLLNEIEIYTRIINSLFTQFKPHDDRFPEEARKDALYSSFFVLKTAMIMLYPFTPKAMDRVRKSLNLPESIFSINELGEVITAGHRIGEKEIVFAKL